VETGKDTYAYLFEQDWFDIGTAVSYEEAKRKIELDTRAFSAKKRPTIDKGEA
jgi:NDP-sugar pyrophosphorylase family protein